MTGSRKVNMGVLSASVSEHERQLRYHLTGPLSRFFAKLYHESLETAKATDKPGPNDDLTLFQRQLKLIPNWNQKTIESVVDLILEWLRNRHFKIAQSIKTVVVGRTMLMVAMGNADGAVDDRVRVDVPDQYTFVHNVLSAAAHELYGFPSLQRINPRDTEIDVRNKQEQTKAIIERAIENTILDQLSSPAVFAYLDQAMRADALDGTSDDEDEEDDGDDEGAAPPDDNFAAAAAAAMSTFDAPGPAAAAAAGGEPQLQQLPAGQPQPLQEASALPPPVAGPAPGAPAAAVDATFDEDDEDMMSEAGAGGSGGGEPAAAAAAADLGGLRAPGATSYPDAARMVATPATQQLRDNTLQPHEQPRIRPAQIDETYYTRPPAVAAPTRLA